MHSITEHYSLGLSPFYLERIKGELTMEQALNIKRLAKIASKDPKNVYPGYRDGVLLIKLPDSVTFVSRTIKLTPGDILTTAYIPRVPGEEPRKIAAISLRFDDPRITPAKSTYVVLYHKDVLAEDNERVEDDWVIVANLTSVTNEPEPLDPDTLICNHFHFSGGTNTGWNAAQFQDGLRLSYAFWRDKAHLNIIKEINEP